jgi:hypothetical protein
MRGAVVGRVFLELGVDAPEQVCVLEVLPGVVQVREGPAHEPAAHGVVGEANLLEPALVAPPLRDLHVVGPAPLPLLRERPLELLADGLTLEDHVGVLEGVLLVGRVGEVVPADVAAPGDRPALVRHQDLVVVGGDHVTDRRDEPLGEDQLGVEDLHLGGG